MRTVVFALIVIGCAHKEPVSIGQRAPASSCLADELGAIRGGDWQGADCTDRVAACQAKCDAGDGDTCVGLGFERKEHVPADEVMAIFAHACKLGTARGCTQYAQWLKKTTAPDAPACAERMFKKMCDVKEPYGCAAAGRAMIERGGADVARGQALLQRTCDEMLGAPCYMLAIYMQNGKLPSDETKLGDLLGKACLGNIADACDPYGLRFQNTHR